MKSNWLFVVVAIVSMAIFAGTARADVIVPTAASDDNGASASATPVTNLIDGIKNNTGQWYTDSSGAATDYFASAQPIPQFTFTLGDSSAGYDLTGVSTWNYGSTGGNAVKTFTLQYSMDGTSWAGNDIVDAASQTTTFTSTTSQGWAQIDYTFEDTVTAKYIRMVVTDNYYDGGTSGDRVGIAEVNFTGTVVPEPSTVLLAGIGLIGLMAYAWRKRK